MRAPDILKRAAQHMEDRAAARDQAQGERSMRRTVDAFNALTGHQLTERDGWMFMVALKAARACTTPTGIVDDYEDGAAYFGLAGESAAASIAKVPDGYSDAFQRMADDMKGVSFKSARPMPVDDGTEVEIPIEVVGMLRVPTGYKWVAQDENGAWWAYEKEPSRKRRTWGSDGEARPISDAGPSAPNWRDTLRQVRQ